MVVREWLRDGVEPERVERVAREAARRLADVSGSAPGTGVSGVAPETGDTNEERRIEGSPDTGGEGQTETWDDADVEPIETDNWLSMPVVVDRTYLVKVTSRRNSLVHALFTAGRNLGAFSSGVEGFFEHHADPAAMVRHELEATRRIREAGVNAPRPIEAFEIDGLGVLVSEYLPDPKPLSSLSDERIRELAPEVLSMLGRMHDAGLAHGDLQAENVLLSAGELYVIDATNVRDDPDARANARAYDVASALAMLAPRVGARDAVSFVRDEYSDGDLLAAREFLPFVALRPDHEFDDARVTSAIDAVVDVDADADAGVGPATTTGTDLEMPAELADVDDIDDLDRSRGDAG